MAEREIWFEYGRSPGRITAIPVSLAGWLVLFGAMIVPAAISLTLGLAAMRVHPLLFGLVLVVSLGASLATLFTLVVRRGRRVS